MCPLTRLVAKLHFYFVVLCVKGWLPPAEGSISYLLSSQVRYCVRASYQLAVVSDKINGGLLVYLINYLAQATQTVVQLDWGPLQKAGLVKTPS